jgi:hypothetical protein
MTTEFRDYANTIADEIIALSLQLDNEIETWKDVFVRVPDSTSNGVSAGFISKPVTNSTIEIVVDIQAPPAWKTARLRIWTIETTKDSDGNERFNNVQIMYTLDYDAARKLVEQSDSLTRDDFSTLAHDSTNEIENIVVSDLTGKDATTEQQLGKRYDLETDELNSMDEERSNELASVMNTVLERLKKSAANK